MKRNLLLLSLLLAVAGNTAAQENSSDFFAQDTKWYGYLHKHYFSSHQSSSISYHLGADTIIDGKTWRGLYRNDVYQGGVRSEEEQVWLYPDTILLENFFIDSIAPILLYDFSLQEGDTIYEHADYSPGFVYEKEAEYCNYLVVKSVSEIYGRKVIDFEGYERWIEGISCPFLEHWRLITTGGTNYSETIHQVVADDATIYFNGEIANPGIKPWLKAGMEWTERKQYAEGDGYVNRKIKLDEGSIPDRFYVSADKTKYELPFEVLQTINDKVYALGLGSYFLCYDFSLSEEDRISLLSYHCYGLNSDTYEYDECYVTKVDTIMYSDGIPRKRITLSGDREDVWVEGIGSLTRVFPIDGVEDQGQSHTAIFSEVVDCSYNGQYIYKNTYQGIDTVSIPNNGTYYDLMGRKVAQPTRGIYIREGRKVLIE